MPNPIVINNQIHLGFTNAYVTVSAGFPSSTDTCTVSYTLDGVPFESYSPSNTGLGKNADFYGQYHAKKLNDGPYYVVATAVTQVLGIEMSCAGGGVFAEFAGANFWGPLVDSP
jgi:hypothetical protein